jgi:4-methylaminobutanoate oxidase (formaldehyde-forming)
VGVPLHACEHYYLVTESIADLPRDLPVLRSYCDGTYFKEDAGKLLFGFAHHHAKPWATAGIPEPFAFESLPFIEDDVMDVIEMAMKRVPLLEQVGIRTFFNGPESYSYDGQFTLGTAPDLSNYFMLAGLNSTGIQTGPGAGRALAEWIVNGYPTLDLSGMDPARCEPFQARDRTCKHDALRRWCEPTRCIGPIISEKQREILGVHPFTIACESRAPALLRPRAGSVQAGMRPEGVAPQYDYSFGRQNWFEYALDEQRAARERVAIVDYSMLGKISVEGSGAEAFLQRVCTNNIAMACGPYCLHALT